VFVNVRGRCAENMLENACEQRRTLIKKNAGERSVRPYFWTVTNGKNSIRIFRVIIEPFIGFNFKKNGYKYAIKGSLG
jgi:hypothetical protein